MGILGSKSMLLSDVGIDLARWKELREERGEVADLEKFVQHMHGNHFIPNMALVDCTADSAIVGYYYDWLHKGIHVVTPNKKANSGLLDQYKVIWRFLSFLQRVHAARPSNSNSLTFLVTVLLLFMILNSHQMSPNFLLWLVLGVFFMATMLRMYATCQQLQAQAQAHAAAASGLLGHIELRLHMPPSIALASRGRLQGPRLQLALLVRV
ncbi:E3 ubiquitin-protein ligase SDIR1-like [Cicer arietinum]|uniref:E3 ubiquitin-protein ligase SDIR1-like n=1 Tax=Cicer arietinum TaxID=3827 RepID=A0A1S2Z179_CICAR|nr:E3 ubiquitin-protein ligase SDIR1-like [Cicer arietinum]XP_004513153.2 E3 ubiquitin-protein ligase SDIR1-like [Cicer arietinum]XP_004513881.2 E3 ubiquitin-protein ligase SDIR1-like [Cicer arietinum]